MSIRPGKGPQHLRRQRVAGARAASTRASTVPHTIDEYIAGVALKAQPILRKIRATVAAAAPDAEERISYRMPAYLHNGVLIYFAAFKNHIGVFPPVSGDAQLERQNDAKAAARTRGRARSRSR